MLKTIREWGIKKCLKGLRKRGVFAVLLWIRLVLYKEWYAKAVVKKRWWTDIHYDYAYNWLNRHMRRFIDKTAKQLKSSLKTEEVEREKKRIWILWFQGYEAAPEIVKRCIESAKKYSKGHEVVVLDDTNLSEYVELPDYVIKKYEQNIITMQQMSDIIRLALLNRWGGLWLDATIYVTEPIPDVWFEEPICVYRYGEIENAFPYIFVGMSVIGADKGNLIISLMYEIMLEYWRRYRFIIEYLQINIFFTLAIAHSEEAKRMFENIPYFSMDSSTILSRELGATYSRERAQAVKRAVVLHKLYHDAERENFKEDSNLVRICDNLY